MLTIDDFSGAGATSLQALMEEGEDMKSFQQKRKSLRQNIPLTTFLLLFFAVVSFGLYFGRCVYVCVCVCIYLYIYVCSDARA